MTSILDKYKDRFTDHKPEEMTVLEYLDLCKEDPSVVTTSAERMLVAIGTPSIIDTRKDERQSRIFSNRKIRVYPAFSEFYGMEEVVEKIVAYFKHAAQGLEESKQILYLLGPVGGGKSSLAEKLKSLMEQIPFYALKAYNAEMGEWQISPVYENPLGLFNAEGDAAELKKEFGIHSRYLGSILSPWAVKRLDEADGDLTQFKVVKLWPSVLNQVGVTKVEPGDENNQDISALVGKVNIRRLEDYDQDDPDAYNWAGGLNITTQGLLEFVEMFKAPIKMLHPMLTATQESHYNGTEQFGAIPFQGVILAHSNESEWTTFRNNPNNEAFLDRVYIVKVPYTLRTSEEARIYGKLIDNSELADANCAPGTLEMMSEFSVLTRLHTPENSIFFSKMKVYNGDSMKDKDPKAKSITEYRDFAGVDEGMNGFSTRQAFKILSRVFNYDGDEVAANPVHLMFILEKQIVAEQYPKEIEEKWVSFIRGILAPKYAEFIGDEIQKAYLEAYDEYGQNLFERYIQYADFWLQDQDYRDPDTGEAFDREGLDEWLKGIEQAAGISNPKDFRNEVVQYVLRAKANNQGASPAWTSYEKLREVIEKKMFANTEELLPVISFGKKASKDEQTKHDDFVTRMATKGYTRKQVRLLVEWFMRYRKHN
jgi:serine protein kinase